MAFDQKFVTRLYPDGDEAAFITKIEAADKGVSEVGKKGLRPFPALQRLDLASNQLTEFGGLAASPSLKWLSLANNRITAVPELDIPELQVLNVSGNQLSGRVKIVGVPKLRALILGLSALPDLNTIVLKDNSVTELGGTLRGCTTLEKLSMANNELRSLETSLADCRLLQELRVGHNDIGSLPEALSANTRLKIVDLGGNPIRQLSDIEVLKQLPLLQQLNVKGCPLAMQVGHPDNLLEFLPLVEILDGKRVRPRIKGRLKGADDGGASAAVEPACGQNAAKSGNKAMGSSAQSQEKGSTTDGWHTQGTGSQTLKRQKQLALLEEQSKTKPRTSQAAPAGTSNPATTRPEQSHHLSAAAGTAATRSKSFKPALQPADSDSDNAAAAPAADAERSFLDEVLSTGTVARTADKKAGQGGKPASGVVAVIDAAGKKQRKGWKRKPSAAVESSAPLSGTSVAQLLRSGQGLAITSVGAAPANGASAWDDPEEASMAAIETGDALPNSDTARKKKRKGKQSG